VESAGMSNSIPFAQTNTAAAVTAAGSALGPGRQVSVDWRIVGGDYFRTMDIPILRGRGFNASDTPETARAAVISEKLARLLWPGENAVGKLIRMQEEDWMVAGVAGDVRQASLLDDPRPAVYLRYGQTLWPEMTLVIRTPAGTAGHPAEYADSLRSTIRGIDPNVPVFQVRALREIVDDARFTPRLNATFLLAFACIALLLSVVGLYGAVSYTVTQRTPEIGVRMALGAAPGKVIAMIMRQSVGLIAGGVGLGCLLGFASARAVPTLFYGVQPFDAATYLSVACLFAAVTLAACYLPARKAVHIDPIAALRAE